MSDLLTKEMDKSQLLENQLAENLKKVRMLTTGTTTLDHLLTIGQCPSSCWGLASSDVRIKDESEGEDDQTGEQQVDLDRAKVHKYLSSTDVIGDKYPNRPRTSSSMAIGPRTSQARSQRIDRALAKLGLYVATEHAHGSVAT
ncbi:hypothetical protein DY000_02024013 [Brassica cretica]|uniref:Uncharacterized protein n=1 Tax=Brassica cretica TaxID=69181 RepID=A0ABQ7E662_BRACR|nr:hypothetical protein DY000_02024013 [Brassica cretica]